MFGLFDSNFDYTRNIRAMNNEIVNGALLLITSGTNFFRFGKDKRLIL